MIWEEWKDKDHVVYPALASGKLDGSKMYSTWREGRVFLNTRSAKEHKNFRHIEEALAKFYRENPHIVLDGEAYNHEYRERFEELQSIFRKQDPTEEQRQLSAEVAKFYIYDAVSLNVPNMDARNRQTLLSQIYNQYFKDYECIVLWKSEIVNSEEEYDEFHEKCMDNGFEGSVLKIMDAPYVQRKNKMVMKRKPKFDCEFRVVDIVEGTGTHKDLAAGVTIDLQFVDGMNIGHREKLAEDFQDAGIASGWNHSMLKNMLINKEDYIGKMATIEYGGLTAYGKLRFPKFKALRTD
jgi:ATP-dependent DNA ligase